jgi:subtilisin-like proprotein convertase family protein
MKKLQLMLLVSVFFVNLGFSQNNRYWTQHTNDEKKITTDKGVARLSFPKEFKLFDLNTEGIRQELFSIVGSNSQKHSTIISLPNADGNLEQFQVFEASNFEADLQVQFPEIRAFSGKGVTDKYASLKISISPQGIQTMIFRSDKETEFIEPYSQDHTIYAVFKSQRQKGVLAWTCSTDEKAMATDISQKISANKSALINTGELRTMRLAQSCNAEYSNYFGATSDTQVSLVLAAYNATLTRCNGVYEKDLALHLNLVASSTNVIYYDPANDPYTTLGQWNTQLQKALNTTLTGPGTTLSANNAAYDIGHMFGASGGGGNAGCIGCVCVNGTVAGTGATKGRGITSPSDGIPQGDNFDIDYVVHEIGHQLGGTHTFSNSNEGSGTNKEVGSGITIMGYAGITGQDVAPHSIDIYHATTIEQIQSNLIGRSCIVLTSLAGTNATPVVNPMSNFTIPANTPFVLTGSASDANSADALTYCWEQNDDGGSSTGASSSASTTKVIGPNFISFLPSASPSRYFPRLSSIIANSNTTAATGNDVGILSEALSSVSRVLNFRLTVRDNVLYSSVAPIKVGQTNFADMVVTINATAGPFLVTLPNTGSESWSVGSNQNITWDVAGTTANNINAEFVDIFLSTDGGLTYPIQLASKVPNDGSETITVPNSVGVNNRIMVKGYKHIFFDISNSNFAITTATNNFAIAYNGVADQQNKETCAGATQIVYNFPYTTYNGFSGVTNFTVSGLPTNAVGTFSQTSATANASISLSVTTNNVAAGFYSLLVSATSGNTIVTTPFYLRVYSANFAVVSLTSPANLAVTQPTSLNLTWQAVANAISYEVQLSTDQNFINNVLSAVVTGTSYPVSNLLEVTNFYWRIKPKNPSCSGAFGNSFNFSTGMVVCNTIVATNVPVTILTTLNVTSNSTLNIADTSVISDLNVSINVQHTWVNDMTITLISPAGTEVQLVNRPCASAALNDVIATFDDSGIALTCANNPAVSGTIKPTQLLSAFNGQSANGVWTLRVFDAFNGDGGAINGWSLNICKTEAALGVSSSGFVNLSVFPNPSKDQVTVQFQPQSSEPIAITIYDLRGRQISTNNYSNSGNFTETISLSNFTSGVYLLKIKDGESVVTKKIIKK